MIRKSSFLLHMSGKSIIFAANFDAKEVIMAIMTVQIPAAQVGWFEQMVKTLGWVVSKKESSVESTEDSPSVTPALRRRINKARKEYAEGQTIKCRTKQEMQQFFDSL